MCDPGEGQVYRWTSVEGCRARHSGHPVEILRCATVETLRSLGNGLFERPSYQPKVAGPCPGRPGIVCHDRHPPFTDRDLLEIYLRHGLTLRVLLHRKAAPAPFYFRVLFSRYFPDDDYPKGGDCFDLITSMSPAFHSAIEEGELFSRGGGAPFGSGPISTDNCLELNRHFHNGMDYKLELYARCFEWMHWGHVLARYGEFLKIILCFSDKLLFSRRKKSFTCITLFLELIFLRVSRAASSQRG